MIVAMFVSTVSSASTGCEPCLRVQLADHALKLNQDFTSFTHALLSRRRMNANIAAGQLFVFLSQLPIPTCLFVFTNLSELTSHKQSNSKTSISLASGGSTSLRSYRYTSAVVLSASQVSTGRASIDSPVAPHNY